MKELSKLRPPFLAKARLRWRLWRHYLQLRKEQGSVFLSLSRAVAFGSLAVIIASSIGLTTIYAYRSDEVTTFNTLYPVKHTLENWALAITQSPLDKAQMYLELATKRSREAKTQVQQNQKVDPHTLAAITSNNTQALIATKSIEDSKVRKEMEQKIIATSQEQVITLKEVKAASIKIAAEAREISIEEIAKKDISLGTPDIGANPQNTNEEIRLNDMPTTSETLIAETPELKLVEEVINETKKLTNESPVSEETPSISEGRKSSTTASGANILDSQLESVSLSTNLP
ncbi:MAG: hypothetical protein HY817_00455 [Candidatus Abawacabacteria bacterium]|nr:hypothetical protein [Candidatus Abawacabacteria bacterium]